MTLTKKTNRVAYRKMVEKNIESAGEFFLRLAEHPEEVDSFPHDSIVIGLPRDDPEQFEANMKLAYDIAQNGVWGKEGRRPIVLLPE